ncbi:hypothetical protein HKB37_27575 [Vibrio parahaemolyticus]|uniref:hypothetical protein n=1 Tax=Vibrio TaxID=662 RepID=UPI0007800F7B|nr:MULTISPECIES: hypothetical protein [Vibrio]KYN81403.1 hypothetical protein ATY36_15080 [Vibrio cidicii]NMS18291.1 hypothetical protein [Vibrio parahaemolyticus]
MLKINHYNVIFTVQAAKEEELEWLVKYLTVEHQDFYDKFRDNLRKKKKRAQKKKVQTRNLNAEEKVSRAGKLAHKRFPM